MRALEKPTEGRLDEHRNRLPDSEIGRCMQNVPLSPALLGARILIVEEALPVAMDLEDQPKREGCGIGPTSRETKKLLQSLNKTGLTLSCPSQSGW
jgi:hypothetical protein